MEPLFTVWTSRQLADELGADQGRITKIARRRRWRRWEGEWLFTDEQADEIRRTIRAWDEPRPAVATPCSVDGCDADATRQGMCNAHYQRHLRHGSAENLAGAHQRAKTRCPRGHPYDDENTLVYPSDGRRRCRTCRDAGLAARRAGQAARSADQ
ncbi:hypothetical protein [Luteimicrobium sp. DT211]|uniref:hypothetical protein n=1 Tax=Luteimicrobium sp. DT211 TaxID=3393412 RepID=UPI003CF11D28